VALIEAVGIRCVKPPPHQQQCRSKSYDSFDKVERCFNTVAVFGNNDERVFFVKFRLFDKVETNGTCSICVDFVEMTKLYENTRSALLPKTATMSKQSSTLSKQHSILSFDW